MRTRRGSRTATPSACCGSDHSAQVALFEPGEHTSPDSFGNWGARSAKMYGASTDAVQIGRFRVSRPSTGSVTSHYRLIVLLERPFAWPRDSNPSPFHTDGLVLGRSSL